MQGVVPLEAGTCQAADEGGSGLRDMRHPQDESPLR